MDPYEIVHSIPGRLRVRNEALRRFPGFAEGFIDALASRSGILSVRVNRRCASAVIVYNPKVLTLRDAQHLIQVTPVRPLPAAPKGADSSAPPGIIDRLVAAGRRLAPPWAQIVLGAASLAISVLGFALPLAPSLLATAITPIIGRALRVLAQERRIGVDALDGTVAVMMVIQRNVVASGVMATLIALGEFIRERTARRSRALITDLLGLSGRSAWIVRGRRRVRVPAEQVKVGQTVAVYTGEIVPVDGVIIEGHASIDQRSLTGESMPAE